jgi:hypothetical protein
VKPTVFSARTPRIQDCGSKQVHPDPPIYSARVGIGYRAVGILDGDTVIWYWIGSHADYDELLKHL